MSLDVQTHLDRLDREGFSLIEDFCDPEAVRSALVPHLGHHRGRNDFEGHMTERVYTLVARGRVLEAVTEEARVLAILDPLLKPGYLLTASQAINIHPGETAQTLHYDDSFYPLRRPRPAISYSLIAAIDDFTAENGGTEIIPGSHRWGEDELARLRAEPDWAERQLVPMVMPAGTCVIFSGTLIHRGGANRSAGARLALTSQYCEPWARTQENFFLGIPREIVATFSPRLKTLLGYSIWPTFMGHVTASHPLKTLEPDYVAPVTTAPRVQF